MDLQHMEKYKNFIYEVYREKSFSRAAKKLYVSQLWLSAAVKRVEQELGVQLFDRSTTPISLTEAGSCYIRYVEEVRRSEQELLQQLEALRDSQQVLHIGSSMFFCTYVLPRLLEEFRVMHPHVILRFEEGTSSTLLQRLCSGDLDVVVEAEQLIHDDVEHVPWIQEELVLAVPASFAINRRLTDYGYSFDEFLQRHTLAKPPVPLAAFQSEGFLFLHEGNDSYTRGMAMCDHAGFTPHVSLYLTQMMTAYYLVCEGQGIAFLRSTIPEYVIPTESVVFYRIDDELARRQAYVTYPQKRVSPLQKDLIQFLCNS